ncbi:type VI secretion system protein TssA [Paraglaciecola arctica]|uniref:type VI secretion system protein TssA n=1 Tax=Paraglaciecola arctica TaxID=1128911 RepID=UPI001C07B793|nr:type VI secretion system protein TssA [Paraglaciecola arctica]MBU3004985.1 type VI secretion system protein TssA [Paraglaciecola arctica]
MDYDQEIISDISGDTVCGVNLEDDSGFQNFFFESQGTAERFDGNSTIPAEPPEWRAVKKQALEFMKKTRDLNLISVLAQSALNTEGIFKFEQCLNGLSQLVKNKWQDVYPELDEDDGDPLERISAMGHLSDRNFVINTLRTLPLVHSKILGNVTLQLIDNAISPSESKKDDSTEIELSQIIGIFKESNVEETTALFQSVNQCVVHLNDINQTFIEHAGNEYSVDFDALISELNQVSSALKKYGNLEVEVVTTTDEGVESSEGQQTEGVTTTSAGSVNFNSANMKLTSRQDVERCFDLILSYYNEYEPSSPVPILIGRANKLVNLDFLDIVKDIFPDALTQVQSLGGISDSE